MGFWTLGSLAKMTRGGWIRKPKDLSDPVAGVSIDTRTLGEGEAFVAIHGPRFDGHKFLRTAIKRGASLLIVTRREAARLLHGDGPPVLVVPDAVGALQDLARAYRDVLATTGTKVVAVTGSNGKTTTRHLIHALLSVSSRGTQSPKSFNNHIGVPLTLLGAGEGDGFVVVEVGTNHPGEVEALAQIVRPDVAVITNVGPAHLEGFGTVQNIAAEKIALLRHTREMAVVPADPPTAGLLAPLIKGLSDHIHVSRFGCSSAADVRIDAVTSSGDRLRVDIEGSGVFEVPLLGRHNAMNLAAAWAVARWLNGEIQDTEPYQRALSEIQPASGRLQVRRIGALRIIHDAYNANPGSVAAAIQTLASIDTTRRILVLGDMLELGDSAVEEHVRVGELIAATVGIDRVVLVGELCRHTADVLRAVGVPVVWYEALDTKATSEIAAEIVKYARNEDGEVAVLLKASRGLGLEQLIEALENATEIGVASGG